MSTNSPPKPQKNQSITLTPMHRLPILITALGLLFFIPPISIWPAILICGFGLFLLLQSFTLKLKFTQEEMIVLQLNNELRRFPYKNWIAWKIILPQLPGLLYFREEASPHLLPILFDPKSLEEQLNLRLGNLKVETN
tara:strand:+ start:692 stop:1105 length:414 start_codon:yes stop_codon:yes gene_type:complete